MNHFLPMSADRSADEAGQFPEPDPTDWMDEDADADGADEHHPPVDAHSPAPPPLRAVVDDAQLCGWIALIAHERDEQALAQLYDATVSRVHALVLQIVRRPAWAEEVVEEAYYQVWRQALRFDPARGRAMTWLLGMARSRALDALRREQRFVHETLDADSLPEDAAAAFTLDAVVDTTRDHAHLHSALASLGAPARQLVALAFLRGLSHEEIAVQTALPLGTVKSHIRRALLTLREQLAAAGLQATAL